MYTYARSTVGNAAENGLDLSLGDPSADADSVSDNLSARDQVAAGLGGEFDGRGGLARGHEVLTRDDAGGDLGGRRGHGEAAGEEREGS